MLYLAIPAHNEVATIGVLLWRLRTVLAEFPREYEVVVYDDASTDDTATVAEQYERAMPVSVLRGTSRLGYAGAVDALLRHIAAQTRYPRRDAVLLLQGDFTDPPGIVPEFARRFEGGADLVVGERLTVADAPKAVKRLFTYAHWAMRAFVKVEGVKDLTASMRLVRISALREAIREAGSAPLVSGDSWTANTDLLLRLAPHARRVESVPMEPTFGVRMRDTRRVAMSDTVGALKWAWGARGRRAVVGSSPAEPAGDERRPRGGSRRRDEPELSVERLREKVRDRDGSSGIDGEPQDARRRRGRDSGRDGGRDQERGRGERSARTEARSDTRSDARNDRAERGERVEPSREPREGRATREGRDGRTPRESREKRAPRAERSTERSAEPRSGRRRGEPRPSAADATMELVDPFAAPGARDERRVDALASAADAPRLGESAGDLPIAGDVAASEAGMSAPSAGRERSPYRGPDESDAAGHDADRRDEGMDDGDDAEETGAEAGGDGEDGGVDADGNPRKRRRNRRSRRGRRRKGARGAQGEENGEADGGEDGGASGEAADEAADGADSPDDRGADAEGAAPRARRERVRFTPGDHIDGEPVRVSGHEGADGNGAGDDTGDDAGDDAGDDERGGVESMSDSAARPRRRGRRGRRGGARRSRGRKDQGEAGDAPAE